MRLVSIVGNGKSAFFSDTNPSLNDSIHMQAMLDDSAETPSIQLLVDGAVASVTVMPAAAFPLADMLVSLCSQDSGKNKQQVFEGLVQHLRKLGSAQVSLQIHGESQLLHPYWIGRGLHVPEHCEILPESF